MVPDQAEADVQLTLPPVGMVILELVVDVPVGVVVLGLVVGVPAGVDVVEVRVV